ncbi:MAG: sulfonate ABC transporter [Candidatus Omnitrophica bacterium]|nr:sulfonate ABC transporter [Candidatus Omnitrophota bacterium]MBD3269544.1 sulfonate ABC transporter [Candidatus Omnitrophota bacterium]
MAQNKKVRCPHCSENFDFQDDLSAGDITYCSACYAELEVVDPESGKVRLKEDEDYDDEEGYEVYRQDDEEY